MNRQPARPSLFPYTTLFRSSYIKLQGSQDFQVWPSDAAAQIGLRRFRPESIPLASKADVAASPHDARLIPEGGLSLCNCEQTFSFEFIRPPRESGQPVRLTCSLLPARSDDSSSPINSCSSSSRNSAKIL